VIFLVMWNSQLLELVGASLLLGDRLWELLANAELIHSACHFSSARMRDNLGG
jgi:hypothetical protein